MCNIENDNMSVRERERESSINRKMCTCIIECVIKVWRDKEMFVNVRLKEREIAYV